MTPAEENPGSRELSRRGAPGSAGRRIRWRLIGASLVFLVTGAALILSRSRAGSDPDRLWEKGQADYESNRLDAAESVVRDLARLRPATVNDSILRAEVHMARGRTESALAALARVPDAHREAPQARFLSGKLEFERSHARAAEGHWKRAVALDPGRIEARRSLSYLYALQLRKQEFDEQFREIAERQPVTFAHAYFWSQINCGIFDPSEAAVTLKRFLDADAGDRQSRFALFEVYLRLERVEDAERLLAALPECDADGRAARARAALLKGDDAGLASLMAGAKTNHPGMARIRGRLALLKGDGPAAVRDFRSALATDPDDHETLQSLAKALRLTGDDAGSGAYMERARVQSRLWELVQRAARGTASTDLTLLQSLGQACEAANRPREARAWYTLVIARDPLDPDAQHSLYRLSTAK